MYKMFISGKKRKIEKLENCSSIEEGLNELWRIYIAGYLALIKKNEMFLHVLKRNNFKVNIVQGRNIYII